MPEPLSDAYLLECEMRARQFSGAFTGTSGTLAADVLRLLAELSRVNGEAAARDAGSRNAGVWWNRLPPRPRVPFKGPSC